MNIADLIIKLSMDSSGVKRGADKAITSIHSLANITKKTLGGLGIGMAFNSFRQMAKDAQELTAQANKLNISTDRFLELSHAAKETSQSVEELLKKLKEIPGTAAAIEPLIQAFRQAQLLQMTPTGTRDLSDAGDDMGFWGRTGKNFVGGLGSSIYDAMRSLVVKSIAGAGWLTGDEKQREEMERLWAMYDRDLGGGQSIADSERGLERMKVLAAMQMWAAAEKKTTLPAMKMGKAVLHSRTPIATDQLSRMGMFMGGYSQAQVLLQQQLQATRLMTQEIRDLHTTIKTDAE